MVEITDKDKESARTWYDSDRPTSEQVKKFGLTKAREDDIVWAFSVGHSIQRERAERAEADLAHYKETSAPEAVQRLAQVDDFNEQLSNDLMEARNQVKIMKADVEAACGELLVSMDDSPPGSLVSQLVIANRILSSRIRAVETELDESNGTKTRGEELRPWGRDHEGESNK